jgi:aminomethyltransferase
MLKRTPLFETHQSAGGRLIEFGGWEMPVQYTSIVDEHHTVRKAAGLFDIAHMGEFEVSGPEAGSWLNRILTNDIRKLSVGQAQYSLLCNQSGGVVDDLYVYRTGEMAFLIIVNASRIDADFAWMSAQLPAEGVTFTNRSAELGAVALQGPASAAFVNHVLPGPSTGGTLVSQPTDLQKNEIARFGFHGTEVWVARTGYTGEDGFEVVAPGELLAPLWEALMTAGASHGVKPCGLGARDTLRTEVCYPLYGHELGEDITPLEAGVGFFVAFEKGPFTGRDALASQKAAGISRKCVAFKMTDKSAPPRPQYVVWSVGEGAAAAGQVVSGTQSPSLNVGIGLAYVPAVLSKPGTPLEIEIRGRRFPAVVVAKPIYRKA